MGYFSSPDRIFAPSRSRLVFLLLGIAAYAATELGRFVYRPYARQNHLSDFGLADSVGNLGGIGVQIFLGLAILNSTRRQSYRMAAFSAVGYGVSVAVIAVVWKTVEGANGPGGRGDADGVVVE